jgi:thiol-disulfide isomerase/thioredoxin
VVEEFGGRARFEVENYGQSELATRFGVRRYPALFVNDVLVATPKDFGFYGKGEGAGNGRYTPLRSPETHQRIRDDLHRMITLALAGSKFTPPTAQGSAAAASSGPERLPAFTIRDLSGAPIAAADLQGRVVLVEFWATWCPPCRGTLKWLGELQKRHGDKLAVVTVAVESDSADVVKASRLVGAPLTWALGTPEIARAFGDISAVPTLFVFDRRGGAAASFFGAPPTLHREAESAIESALSR